MTKVLLLGLGRWGVNHLRNLNTLPVDLYVAELTSQRLAPARKLRIPESHLSTDYKSLLEKVDCTVLAIPAQSHFRICRELLHAGKDVFVEKPIALTSTEARELVRLAGRQKRILQVGHIFRFDPASKWLREAIEAGRFGRLQILRGNFSGFKRPRNDSGVMFADAIHFVDLFNYFVGTPPVSVLAVNQEFMKRGREDASLISLEYRIKSGPIWATVESNYFLPGKYREVTVIGDKLSAVCDYNVSQYKIKTFANRHIKHGNEIKAVEGSLHQVETSPEEPLLAELRDFLDSVQTRKEPLANGQSGVDSVRIIEAALTSAKSGRRVKLR